MGLDVNFYAVKRNNVGSFRKINFFLTYFDIKDEDDGRCILISKAEFEEFVCDLKCELQRHDLYDNLNDETTEKMPKNPKFFNKEVMFGGSMRYDAYYWQDVREVYIWADKTLKEFDWDNERLEIDCWW
jgi:hypothetical protein